MKKLKTKHGTRTLYNAGCDCERCRKANADYQRAYLAKRLAAGIVDNHGKRLER